MALLTESQLRSIGRNRVTILKNATTILKEEATATTLGKGFDIFLSHSMKDAEIVLGLKTFSENQKFTVYVDWIDDPELDRSKVTSKTASRLRERMRQSKSLVYAHSNNSPDSKWMPWELGYFDGFKGAVAILPIAKTDSESFKGQEFLGLYPYMDTTSGQSLYVNLGSASLDLLGKVEGNKTYRAFSDWIRDRSARYAA